MEVVISAARASRQVRTWAIKSAEEFARNLAQLVHYFVPRPPASRGRSSFTFAVWLFATCMALFVVGRVAYRSAHTTNSVIRASGLDTADKVNFGCTETTQYPVTVRFPFCSGNLFEVTLLGPKYQHAQALQNSFKSMECALEVVEGVLYYNVHGNGLVQTNPADYRRTCLAPFHEQNVHVKLSFRDAPTRFLSLFHAVGSVRQLEQRPFSANVSDFIVVQLRVEREKTFLFGRKAYRARSHFDLALEDGRRYVLTFSMYCNLMQPMTQQIIRICTYDPDVPLTGQKVTSDNSARDCPLDMNDPAIVHFIQTLHRVLSHSVMESAVQGWGRTRHQSDVLPELRSALDPFCVREQRHIGYMLADNGVTYHKIDQIIEDLARNISEARVYEVKCDETEFAGVVTFLALSWPLFTLWISFSYLAIPIIYKRARCEFSWRKVGYVGDSKNDLPPSSPVVAHAQEDDSGNEPQVDRNMFEDVDGDSDRCTDDHSPKPFAGDGTATSDCDAERELVFQELMHLLHCLVDAAVSKHVERIGSEMSRAIAESRMPARHVHLEDGDAAQYGGALCDATASGGPHVEHNSESIVEDLQEFQVAIAALSSQFASETSLLCSSTQDVVIGMRSHGSDVEELTCGGASNRHSLLQGSASDPMLMGEASTRLAFMQLMSRLEQRFAALARTTAVDTVSMHLDDCLRARQSLQDPSRSSL